MNLDFSNSGNFRTASGADFNIADQVKANSGRDGCVLSTTAETVTAPAGKVLYPIECLTDLAISAAAFEDPAIMSVTLPHTFPKGTVLYWRLKSITTTSGECLIYKAV